MTVNSLQPYSTYGNRETDADAHENSYRIAIVGGGPKGLYGLERLLANLKEAGPSLPVAIHIFNRSPYFGAGDVYRPGQAEFLLMNYTNVHIDMWPKYGPAPIVPKPLSFLDWLEKEKQQPATPDAYAGRSQVGSYLMEGFEELKAYCPKGVEIHTHLGEVTDIKPVGKTFKLELKTDGGKRILDQHFQQVLLTTGHPQSHSPIPDFSTKSSAREQLAGHVVDFIYPVEEKLSSIRSRENVVIKGLGLTFIDAVLALTEGRGGHFSGTPESGLTYHPSGREPHKIYPYSRSGLPMFPRLGTGSQQKGKRYFFKEERLGKLFADQDRIDFEKEILPLVEQEVISRYYAVLFRRHEKELKISDDYTGVEAQIEEFHRSHPTEQRFSLDQLLQALPQPGIGLHQSFMNQLEAVLEAAKQGARRSPLAAAAAVWRDISSLFNSYYSFGRLSPESHRTFQEMYAGHFNRLAYGPPIINLEKIRAIAKAGCLDFSFVRSPIVEFKPELDGFLLRHACHALHTTACYWVDARIPAIDLSKGGSALYENMLQRGLIRIYQNTDGKTTFCPGCMDLDRAGHPRDKRGRPVKRLTAYGTPTEGITYDNDTLSRQRNDFASNWAKNIVEELQQIRPVVSRQNRNLKIQ